jgi:hypothetical protein
MRRWLVGVATLLGPLYLGTMVLTVVLLVIYIRDAYRNPALGEDRRTFWAVVLFHGNLLAMPVYWWLYMRPGTGARAGRPEPLTEG